jgi:hypothetical protein
MKYRSIIPKFAAFALSLLLVLAAVPANAQATVNSPTASTTVTWTVNESVTLSLTGGPLAPTGPNWFNPVTLSTTWNIQAGHSTAELWAWFSSSSQALLGNPNGQAIPASAFSSQWDGGTTNACGLTGVSGGNGPAPTAGVSPAYCPGKAMTTPLTTLVLSTPETHVFNLELVTPPTGASVYTGTLNFAVVVN